MADASLLEAWPRQFVGTEIVSGSRQLWPPKRLLPGFLEEKKRENSRRRVSSACSRWMVPDDEDEGIIMFTVVMEAIS